MDPLDILYTPLDTAPIPNYDTNQLLDWIKKNQKQTVPERKDASLVTPLHAYPWDISYPMTHKMWRGNFNKLFPDLAKFFYTAYNLEEKDLFTVVLLPIRSDFIGQGFWHSDPDETGLRMYLENTEHDKDFLLLKSSKSPYQSRDNSSSVPNDGNDLRFNKAILKAKIYKPRQVFFLNNIRAIHSANVSTIGAFRIAVIVTIGKNFSQMPEHVKKLIVHSAEKFKDLAVFR